MRVIKTIKPGQHGSRRFVEQYGERLINVRYREDVKNKSIYTTVELIIDQREYLPRVNQSRVYAERNQRWVAAKIAFNETDLRTRAKAKGAQWSKNEKVWVMRYQHAAELGILERVIPNLASRITDVDLFC